VVEEGVSLKNINASKKKKRFTSLEGFSEGTTSTDCVSIDQLFVSSSIDR
jgi:hypothetical protein